jgi:hypothetical protein
MASADAALSLRVTSVGGLVGGGGSVTSAEVQVASAAATSADAHANTVSARVVSVSAELASLLASTSLALATRLNTVSAASGAGDVQGLQSVVNKLSANIQVASAAATSADGHANTVSARAVSISNELGSLLASASLALETHAAAASAAATSADGHANAVSIRAVSISNELGSLLASASTALAARDNTISAAAAAADTHANTVSVRAVSISAELASLVQIASAAATSADGHANTVSVRVVSVSAELASLLASTSLALQSNINALSVFAHGITGGTGSVTSNELSFAVQGYSTFATSTVSVSLSVGTPPETFLTGTAAQPIAMPDVTTLVLGKQYLIKNNSSASATINSSGGNLIVAVPAGNAVVLTCILITGTTAASWDYTMAGSAGVDVVSARVVSVSAELASLVNIVSARAVSISAELASLIVSAAPRKATNTAAQASITVSTGLTVSGVSVALTAGQTYVFQFTIPFTIAAATGLMVAVVGPTTNAYVANYQIPGAAGTTGVAPAANAVTPFFGQVRAINTKVSTTSITLTGTTLMAYAWGTINPSANGSIKFVIGPNTSGAANSGVVPLLGCNLIVSRMA